MSRIKIKLGEITVTAELDSSATAGAVVQALPIESTAQIWGDEVYFDVPLDLEEEDPSSDVPSGTVAYWPPGKALCLFFGQTPYSPVNVIGRLIDDPQVLAEVKAGDSIQIESD